VTIYHNTRHYILLGDRCESLSSVSDRLSGMLLFFCAAVAHAAARWQVSL
jgi:hypothetical protein